MRTTTATPGLALPGVRKPLRARNAAIAALGIVSAVMLAAGAAIGGSKPVPSQPRPPRPRAHQPALRSCTSTSQRPRAAARDRDGLYQLHGGPEPDQFQTFQTFQA